MGLALALALAACGDDSDAGASTEVDGPVMRYPEASASEEGSAAEVRGTLELDGDCLYVFLEEVDERYPVVWPAGTTWDAEEEAVVSPSGVRMAVGTDVSGGGGYHPVDDVERLVGPDAEALAARCVDNTYGEIALVNNSADGIRPAP